MTMRLGAAGQQLGSLRRSNAAAVLGVVRSLGTVSRSEIAVTVGLSPTAVTKIVAELLAAGYVVESERPVAAVREPGRPRRPVLLDRSRLRFVGVHVGLQRVTVGLIDLTGEVVGLRSRAHTSNRPAGVLGGARRLVDELLEQTATPPSAVIGYGACSGGWVSSQTGTVREFAGLGWQEVPLADELRRDDLPTPVVESSVRALALAEAGLAAAQGEESVLYVFVGNVIGCAHVLDGRIARGREEAAGTIDHLASPARGGIVCSCGRRDCLWAVASDAAVVSAAAERGLVPRDAAIEDLVTISQGTGRDATVAARLLRERARRAGHTLGALLDIYDPDVVVIGGGVRLAPEHLPTLVESALERTVLPHDTTPIRSAVLAGPPSLVRGAATPALNAFYADPLATSARPA